MGTEEAIKDEMRRVWASVLGGEGEVMRAAMASLKSRCEESRTRGSSKKAMEALGGCM